MRKNSSDNHPPGNDSFAIFKPGPFSLFVTSVVTIFVAEAFVMLLIYFLDLHDLFFIGLVDAALLSLFVVPCLYYSLLKPMRETILKLDNSETIQSQLVEIDQLKSDLISIASHELCTPVTIIKGYTEMLLDDLEPDRRKEFLEVILSKTNSIERLIDDFGIVDRLETGEKLKVMLKEHDLLETVSLVYDVYSIRFPDMALQLDLPAGPLVFPFDEIRINQLLDNLLSNAVKYSKDLRDVIEVSVIDQGTQALIRVRDNGIGMTEDEVKQVYNKFFRAQTENTFVGGLGLGMAIVKNIVESHNGTIDIVSQREVGTTVTIALPK